MDSSPPPLVSVIIPTYNWSSALRYAIGSVLWQEMQDFELIVVGDGCTDDSEEVVASFGDPRIRWHNLRENTGNQPAPNNAGLAMARGRYIAYLGHDDLWLPAHLGALSHALEESGADLAYPWLEMVGPEPVLIRIICGITANGGYSLGTSLVPTGIMHRRSMVDDIGPWRNHLTINSPPDQEFVERAVAHDKKFIGVKRLTALKFAATWRPNSYVEKPIHQQAAYTRRILANPNFAEEELCNIVEFLFRKHPENIARNDHATNSRPGQLIESSRRMRGLPPMQLHTTPPPEHYPPLPVPARIELGAAASAAYLWHGWSGQEAGFRWTDGEETQIIFSLKELRDTELRVHCGALLVSGKLDSQNVQIVCNAAECGSWAVKEWELDTFAIRLEKDWLESENMLTLRLPNATAPLSMVPGNTDCRRLALRIAWIELDPIPQN